MKPRKMPRVVYRRIVCNQSSRGGQRPRLIVVHSTEGPNIPGTGDLRALAAWFDNPSAQASSHVGVDAEGQSCRMVWDTKKAWTQAAYNPVSLSIEMVGRAAQSAWPTAQVEEVGRWIAYWSKRWDIPIHKGRVSSGRVVEPGVVRHSELGAAGGGHHDPGPGFPLHQAHEYARLIRSTYG